MADPNSVFGQTYDPATRTPTIGLAFTGDKVIDANLSKIDAAFAEVASHIVELSTPPEPPLEEEPANQPADDDESWPPAK